jgi:hypothetical protein
MKRYKRFMKSDHSRKRTIQIDAKKSIKFCNLKIINSHSVYFFCSPRSISMFPGLNINKVDLTDKPWHIFYNDTVFRILLCIVSAFLVAMYGSSAYYLDSISSRSFPVKFAAALFITAFFLQFVYRITVRLDNHFDWKERPFGRLGLQFLLGVILPGLLDYIFLNLYKWYFGLKAGDELLASQGSLPLMVMPVFLLNIYYFAYYHLLRKKDKKKRLRTSRKTLLVNQGNRTVPIPLHEIRYIYHLDRVNILVTAESKEYVLSETLDELENILPNREFFRLNRKAIIHYLACSHFQPHGHGKLLVKLTPQAREEMVVSQARAPKFREWITR